MQSAIKKRRQAIRSSGRRSLTVLMRWYRHERLSLQGHLYALVERVRVARSASNVGQFFHDQWDLLPESRRRLQRNARIRRAILAELGADLRPLLRGGS